MAEHLPSKKEKAKEAVATRATWRRLLIGPAIVVAAAVAYKVLWPRPVAPARGPLVGARAFEIADEVEAWVNGEEIDLADLKGQLVLLYFWHPRDGKSPETLDHVQSIASRYADDGLVTIGLCVCDEPSEVQPLIAEHGLTFRVALDSDADVHIDKYRIDKAGTPYCYLIASDRRICWEGRPEDTAISSLPTGASAGRAGPRTSPAATSVRTSPDSAGLRPP